MQEARRMIVEHSTGATSRDTVDWHSIDWRKAHRIVNRLQARIVQATKAGKRNKVKALQRILTHSFSGKAIAVKRVTENQGKNTPGVDKVLWNTPETKCMPRETVTKPCPVQRRPQSARGIIPCLSWMRGKCAPRDAV